MTDVAGFFYPRTATGRSSLLPAPPWYYSGDLLTVEYRTDPARVAELLPAPLEPAADDPGAVALIWADWQSCGDAGEELLDPVRAQYQECFVVVRCSFGGRVYSRCVYIWVDADFALARGLHQGYPKKLGSIHQTRPHPFGRAAPRIAPGGVFGAHAGRGRPPAGPGGDHAARGVGRQRLRQRPPDGAPPVDAVDREGRPGRARRADRLRQRQRRGRAGLARRRRPWSCSTRPPRSWPGSRSDEIIGGYYRQVGRHLGRRPPARRARRADGQRPVTAGPPAPLDGPHQRQSSLGPNDIDGTAR